MRSYLRARLGETSTWAAFGHSMFLATVAPEVPVWSRLVTGPLAIVAYAVAAALPQHPKS
jgi:hypothetical protein